MKVAATWAITTGQRDEGFALLFDRPYLFPNLTFLLGDEITLLN